jgi:hypothetical protein
VVEHACAELLELAAPFAGIWRLAHGDQLVEHLAVFAHMLVEHGALSQWTPCINRANKIAQRAFFPKIVRAQRISEPGQIVADARLRQLTARPLLGSLPCSVEVAPQIVVLTEEFVTEFAWLHRDCPRRQKPAWGVPLLSTTTTKERRACTRLGRKFCAKAKSCAGRSRDERNYLAGHRASRAPCDGPRQSGHRDPRL